MKRYIKEEDYDTSFLDLWKKTSLEFFKCETRQFYDESGEEEYLSLFKAGNLEELKKILMADVNRPDSIWNEARKKKIKFIRVHIVDKPLSKYLRFEFEAYKVQELFGNEEIWIVESQNLNKKDKSVYKDFMMFDNRSALIVDYNNNEKIVGALITDEIADLKILKAQKTLFLKNGIRFSRYIKK